MVGYVIFTLAVAISIACISYDTMARSKGWPVGGVLEKDYSIPKIAAFVTALWALGKAFFVFQWWSPLLVLGLGWLIGFILTMALKRHAQVLCILGVFPAFFFTVVYISEEKPFGFLHRLFS